MALFAIIITFLALAGGFAWYLVKRDQGEHEPIGALWMAFGLGCLGLLVAAGLELLVLPDVTAPQTGLVTLGWAALAIGIIEESCKLLPVLIFLYHKRYFNEHTDGVIYFALAGLGFGLPENIMYTFQFGAKTGVARLLMTPLFHAATTGLIGYAIARHKLDRTAMLQVYGALACVIGVHALYDFGLFSRIPIFVLLSVMIALALGAGLFLLYLHARSLDQQQGLSAVGHNSFCRSCGHANPKHNLYCSHCGKRA
jgi:RsiW-degrading membrane proteinase PrsW (M82 family)